MNLTLNDVQRYTPCFICGAMGVVNLNGRVRARCGCMGYACECCFRGGYCALCREEPLALTDTLRILDGIGDHNWQMRRLNRYRYWLGYNSGEFKGVRYVIVDLENYFQPIRVNTAAELNRIIFSEPLTVNRFLTVVGKEREADLLYLKMLRASDYFRPCIKQQK